MLLIPFISGLSVEKSKMLTKAAGTTRLGDNFPDSSVTTHVICYWWKGVGMARTQLPIPNNLSGLSLQHRRPLMMHVREAAFPSLELTGGFPVVGGLCSDTNPKGCY